MTLDKATIILAYKNEIARRKFLMARAGLSLPNPLSFYEGAEDARDEGILLMEVRTLRQENDSIQAMKALSGEGNRYDFYRYTSRVNTVFRFIILSVVAVLGDGIISVVWYHKPFFTVWSLVVIGVALLWVIVIPRRIRPIELPPEE